MQTDINITSSKIYVKPCVVDMSKACFLIITQEGVIRITMMANLLKNSLTLIQAALPSDYHPEKNEEIDDINRKFEATIRVADLRVGYDKYNKNAILRLYTGKKRKHSIYLTMNKSQLIQIYQALEAMALVEV